MTTTDDDKRKWKLVPVEPTPAMKEQAAFNLSSEYGSEFVLTNEKYSLDVYRELVSAAPYTSPIAAAVAAEREACAKYLEQMAHDIRVAGLSGSDRARHYDQCAELLRARSNSAGGSGGVLYGTRRRDMTNDAKPNEQQDGPSALSDGLEPKFVQCSCGKPASHYFGGGVSGMCCRGMCCRCYVLAGNPPADWHTECMATYRSNR